MQFDDAMMQLLVATFDTEAQEICATITREVLGLEKLPPGDSRGEQSIREISRMLHTLKGSAATAGLDDLSHIAHALEDLLAPVKAQPSRIADAADCLLRTVDVFLLRLRAYVDKKSETLESSDSLITEIRALASRLAGKDADTAEATRTQAPNAPGHSPSVAPPSDAASEPPQEATEHVAKPSAPAETSIEQNTWRVEAEQVLDLLKQVDRLREIGLRLAERRKMFASIKPGTIVRSDGVEVPMDPIRAAVNADSEETSDIVSRLEEGIKSICTMPIRTIIDPLRRTVRDVARACGKEAELSVVGSELAFDRRALEVLRGPLLHLVRNAVDHGIERPEVRQGLGKHRAGLVAIRIERQGNMAFLEVEDDGAGIDVERIRSIAAERKLMPAEALAAMDPHEVQQLAFHSGFSTRSEVSEYSGRGVGLDVVKNALTKLRGNVELQSRSGHGCKFVLTLPVELGSSPALLVRCLDQVLGIPMLSVESIAPVRREKLHRVRNEARLPFRDDFIPLWDLGALLGLRGAIAPAEGQPAVVVSSRGGFAAVAVDEVIGDRELPIRALPTELSRVPAYQGASMLAQGELVLILGPGWLVDPQRSKSSQLTASQSVLVVDDSLTARALHRSMLEAGGYVVHTVSSARQALEALERSTYTAMVCDIAMEGLDGIGLTSLLRSRPDTRDLPIVLVSAREGEDDRRQGLEAGANGYLTKSECAQGRLLRELSAILEKGRHA